MKHSVHTTLITDSIVRTEVAAESPDEAKAIQIARFPPGLVRSISAWPIDRSPVTLRIGTKTAAAFDSAFGLLV